MKNTPLNDEARRQWISSDEGLWNWYRRSGLSMKSFIRKHRADLDAIIKPTRDGALPQHFLVYGGRR